MKRGVFPLFAFAVSAVIGSFFSNTGSATTLDDILRDWRRTAPNHQGGQIGAQLEQAGLTYQIDEDGDYKMVLDCPEGRTQLVYVISQPTNLGEMEVRRVMAPALVVNGSIEPDVLAILLQHNHGIDIGGWSVTNCDNKQMVFFKAYVAADADAQVLATVTRTVAYMADELEAKLTNTDDL